MQRPSSRLSSGSIRWTALFLVALASLAAPAQAAAQTRLVVFEGFYNPG